jgi:hypothetical protein
MMLNNLGNKHSSFLTNLEDRHDDIVDVRV